MYPQQNLFDIIELEQKIVTGVSNDGTSISNKEIFNEFAKIKNNISDDNNARLLGITLSCLEITEDQFRVMSENISQSQVKAISNLPWLGVSFSEKKSKNRRETKISKDMFQTFKNKTAVLKYNKLLRSTCKMVSLVLGCSGNKLGSEFSFIQEPVIFPKRSVKKKIVSKVMYSEPDDDEALIEGENEPTIFLFVIGGISLNEICALESLNKKEDKMNHRLVLGSTNVLTSKDYIKELGELPSFSGDGLVEDEEIRLKCIKLEGLDP